MADLPTSTGVPPTVSPPLPEDTFVAQIRQDHTHNVVVATAAEITDSTNSEGASTSLSRADHGHAHGNRGGGALHAAATTSTAGFLSSADKTKLDGLGATAAAVINGSTSDPTTTSGTFAVIPEMTITQTMSGKVFVTFSCTVEVQSDDDWDAAIFLDGAEVTGTRRNADFFGGSLLGLTPARIDGFPLHLQALLTGVSTGSHTVDVRWRANAGTARATGTERNLILVGTT